MKAALCEFVHAADEERPVATWQMVGASRTFHICDEHHDSRPHQRGKLWTPIEAAP